jgi:Zn-dependent peptidase ImmA (M78 family)/transcriptional regulator with XRE-family HTH domain
MTSFYGNRLTSAREARGLTMTQLQELSNVSVQSISNYESGKQSPREDNLLSLANALNIPLAYFFRTTNEARFNAVHFRSLSSLTKRDRTKSIRRLEWLSDILNFLGDHLEFVQPNLPSIGLGDNWSKLDLDEIDEIASLTRKTFGIGDGPISNMTMLLENNGIIITRKSLETHELNAFSTWIERDQTPVVVEASNKQSAVFKRFNLAHELGHLILHRDISPTKLTLKQMEKQANRFAAAFLLPSRTFSRDFAIPNLDIFLALKSKWLVSIQAQIMRCRDLDIIDDKSKTRLFIYYSRRWRKDKEPLDDQIPDEEPVFLRRCIELLVTEGILTREDIPRQLSLPENDIEDMVDLPRGWFSRQPFQPIKLPVLKRDTSKSTGTGVVVQFPGKNHKL